MNIDREFYEIIMKQSKGNLITALENQIQSDMGGTRREANITANHILDILDAHREFNNKQMETEMKKPLAVAVRIYQGDMFPMADIRTSPCDGSKLETIVWTNLKERNQFDYNGYTLFYDTRTEKSFSEIR